jgi:DNA primase
MIPELVIEDVKERVDAAAVFARHIELRPSGSGFVARCPFHEDHTPSFRVYPAKARYHCFGCGAHGDVFEFLQRLSGKTFPAVVRELAAEAGVTVVDDVAADAAHRERGEILEACATAQKHFESALWSAPGDPGRAYLRARGISEQTARSLHLGFAACDLATSVLASGRSPRPFVLAGLVVERDGAFADRLCKRVTIPLCGTDGGVLGFSARAVAGGAPRYITTPENAAFRHSRVLFGLEQAAPTIHKAGRALFLPTYFDVLACHEAGVAHAVGGGAGPTARHLETLRRRGAKNVVIVTTQDRPFEPGPELVASVFAAGGSVSIAALPPSAEHTPPAEAFVRANGHAGIEALAAGAMPLSEHLVHRAMRQGASAGGALGLVEAKLGAVTWLARFTSAMPQGMERDLLERWIAQKLRVTLRTVRTAGRAAAEAAGRAPPRRPRGSPRRRC